MVKHQDSEGTGYRPAVMVLNREPIAAEPLWKKRSRITLGDSVVLLIAVVFTNWRTDDLKKLADYEATGIPGHH